VARCLREKRQRAVFGAVQKAKCCTFGQTAILRPEPKIVSRRRLRQSICQPGPEL